MGTEELHALSLAGSLNGSRSTTESEVGLAEKAEGGMHSKLANQQRLRVCGGKVR